MSKSVYSLILNDEVVAAVDRLAYRNRTSRSDMITRILAEHVSVQTPEQRSREILSRLSDMLEVGDTFLLTPGSDSMLSARSALAYKYHPTVRYSVELSGKSPDIGKLRVGMRTQNPTLLRAFANFCRLYAQVESERIGQSEYLIEPGRMTRVLRLRIRCDAEEHDAPALGELIGRYVCVTDACLKANFSRIESQAEAMEQMQQIYAAYARSSAELL